jgi:hypothetical protein
MTEAEQIMKRCQAGTRNYEEANNLHAACYGIIGKLLAQPEQEPIYQYQMANGSWIDQTKESHDYNVRHGQATVRVVHTAPPQLEQEPVAWRTFDGEGGYDYRSYEDNESYADDWNKRNPKHVGWVDELYTHSQRTWVDLTDEQIDACWNKDLWKEKQPHHIFAKAIEAKLKQKNGYAEEKNT